MRFPVLFLIVLIILLTGCLQSIPNDPEFLALFQQRKENLLLEFYTDKGRQVAYYLPPYHLPENPPKKIALLYPGIKTVALGWLRFVDLQEYPSIAYLLIEYPGRGFSKGMMRPEENHKNSQGALKALASHFGLPQLSTSISLLGHSFGTGAALQFANLQEVERIVLVAPFNDLKQAVKRKSWFLSLLMPSQIDNRLLLKRLLASSKPPKIAILHGAQDTTLPISMGRELAQLDPEKIEFHPYDEDNHVNILSRRRELIFDLVNGGDD